MESHPALRFLTKRLRKAEAPRGFTLVEMVVVLAIIVVITGVVINGQSTYNQTLVLTDTAYTVAYSVRQAQSLGLSSQGSVSGSAVYSNVGYGVRFTEGTNYLIYADAGGSNVLGEGLCPQGGDNTPETKRGNCRYDGESPDAIVENYSFSRGFTVSDLCGKYGSGVKDCSITSLDVAFRRPETRAIMSGSGKDPYTCVEVHVRAPTGGATRVVRVSQLGEISVGQTCP